jgi:hypothetical protein
MVTDLAGQPESGVVMIKCPAVLVRSATHVGHPAKCDYLLGQIPDLLSDQSRLLVMNQRLVVALRALVKVAATIGSRSGRRRRAGWLMVRGVVRRLSGLSYLEGADRLGAGPRHCPCRGLHVPAGNLVLGRAVEGDDERDLGRTPCTVVSPWNFRPDIPPIVIRSGPACIVNKRRTACQWPSCGGSGALSGFWRVFRVLARIP